MPVLDVTGAYAGKRTCYVCEFQNDPNVIAFFRDADEQTAELIVQLDKLYRQEKTRTSRPWRFSSRDPTPSPGCEELSKSRNLEIPLVVLAQRSARRRRQALQARSQCPQHRFWSPEIVWSTRMFRILGSSDFDKVKQATLSMLAKSKASKTERRRRTSTSNCGLGSGGGVACCGMAASGCRRPRGRFDRHGKADSTASKRVSAPRCTQIRTVTAKQSPALVDDQQGQGRR